MIISQIYANPPCERGCAGSDTQSAALRVLSRRYPILSMESRIKAAQSSPSTTSYGECSAGWKAKVKDIGWWPLTRVVTNKEFRPALLGKRLRKRADRAGGNVKYIRRTKPVKEHRHSSGRLRRKGRGGKARGVPATLKGVHGNIDRQLRLIDQQMVVK
jgi:hypothetical protein